MCITAITWAIILFYFRLTSKYLKTFIPAWWDRDTCKRIGILCTHKDGNWYIITHKYCTCIQVNWSACKKPSKHRKKKFKNIKTVINIVSTGMSIAKTWLCMCPIGFVMFTRYCGKCRANILLWQVKAFENTNQGRGSSFS